MHCSTSMQSEQATLCTASAKVCDAPPHNRHRCHHARIYLPCACAVLWSRRVTTRSVVGRAAGAVAARALLPASSAVRKMAASTLAAANTDARPRPTTDHSYHSAASAPIAPDSRHRRARLTSATAPPQHPANTRKHTHQRGRLARTSLCCCAQARGCTTTTRQARTQDTAHNTTRLWHSAGGCAPVVTGNLSTESRASVLHATATEGLGAPCARAWGLNHTKHALVHACVASACISAPPAPLTPQPCRCSHPRPPSGLSHTHTHTHTHTHNIVGLTN
jgi:hypothetical protein